MDLPHRADPTEQLENRGQLYHLYGVPSAHRRNLCRTAQLRLRRDQDELPLQHGLQPFDHRYQRGADPAVLLHDRLVPDPREQQAEQVHEPADRVLHGRSLPDGHVHLVQDR